MFSCNHVFTGLFLYRYLRLVVNLVAFCLHRPIPQPVNPRWTSEDVTVVIPSLQGGGVELLETIRSILLTRPFRIILVTIEAQEARAQSLAKELDCGKLQICSVAQPNKRRQMVRAIPVIETEVTVFADDDVTWPSTLLPWMLAPLEDQRYGGVGTNQRLRRADCPSWQQRVWGYLGALYLERRNFDCASCMFMDGGLPCLSGRTVAYRTSILLDKEFTEQFTHEEWLGQYHLNADDDNFITRWLISHGQKISYQYHKQAEVLTTLEDNPKFLKQCLRWSRSNWRSNITSLCCDRHIWKIQPWSTYAVYLTTISHWALLWDCLLIYFYLDMARPWSKESQSMGLAILVTWMFLSKFLKLMGHYIRYPVDFLLLPVSILFGYFHGLIKGYAMVSLNVTAWGSRDGADDDDAYRMTRVSSKYLEACESRSEECYTQ
ncbi:MAG: hypothetical protein LQ350_006143 [Teloschistes chrysophthalmus]|nr:MAG: hypothetical protein LQ350_006143 [Niorma chrysophthalma]